MVCCLSVGLFVCLIIIITKGVLKEMLGYWRGALDWKVVWRYARTMCGAQCVILAGQLRMLEWCVGSLDIP